MSAQPITQPNLQDLIEQVQQNLRNISMITVAPKYPENGPFFLELGSEAADAIFEKAQSVPLNHQDINTLHSNHGKSMLHVACEKGHEKLLRLLLNDPQTDANIREIFNKMTALHYASRAGNDDIVAVLLEHRLNHGPESVDVNAQDKDGYSALHFACINKHFHTCEKLAAVPDCNLNLQDSMLRTPLHRAIEGTQFLCVKALLFAPPRTSPSLEIYVNAQEKNGWTPLHYASYHAMRRTCQMLMERGANNEIKDSTGKKPLYYGYGHWEEEGGCSCPKHRHKQTTNGAPQAQAVASTVMAPEEHSEVALLPPQVKATRSLFSLE